jgi:hypothetical protein
MPTLQLASDDDDDDDWALDSLVQRPPPRRAEDEGDAGEEEGDATWMAPMSHRPQPHARPPPERRLGNGSTTARGSMRERRKGMEGGETNERWRALIQDPGQPCAGRS